MNFMCFVNAD